MCTLKILENCIECNGSNERTVKSIMRESLVEWYVPRWSKRLTMDLSTILRSADVVVVLKSCIEWMAWSVIRSIYHGATWFNHLTCWSLFILPRRNSKQARSSSISFLSRWHRDSKSKSSLKWTRTASASYHTDLRRLKIFNAFPRMGNDQF